LTSNTLYSIYRLTCDENINVARVRARHASGGHDVPEDKIRERYHRALALLPRMIDVCDKILVYDNSIEPVLIFKKDSTTTEMHPNDLWDEAVLQNLLEI